VYKNDKMKVIVASAGISNESLDWSDFNRLIKGETIVKTAPKFIVNHSEGV
jgi:hypothetical protein